MRIKNMENENGNTVPNQFVVEDCKISIVDNGETQTLRGTMFQSYDSNIVFRNDCGKVFIDGNFWDYSKTTGKYRNIFLRETKKQTMAKIESGDYALVDLNN